MIVTDSDSLTISLSNEVSGTTINAAPSTVTLTEYNKTSYSVTVAWSSAINTHDFASYRPFKDTVEQSQITNINTVSYIYSGLSPSTNYTFYVRSVDSGGLYSNSNTLNINTDLQ
jgi:hypothetical protein